MKKSIIFFIIFLIETNLNLISYAETNNIKKINNTISQDTSNKNNIEVSNNWIASIFIPGLGQMLMGEIGRGILFLIGTIVSFIVPNILYVMNTWTSDRTGGFNDLLFGSICMLIVYIWNISDSYYLSVEKSKSININTSDFNNFNIIKYTLQF